LKKLKKVLNFILNDNFSIENLTPRTLDLN